MSTTSRPRKRTRDDEPAPRTSAKAPLKASPVASGSSAGPEKRTDGGEEGEIEEGEESERLQAEETPREEGAGRSRAKRRKTDPAQGLAPPAGPTNDGASSPAYSLAPASVDLDRNADAEGEDVDAEGSVDEDVVVATTAEEAGPPTTATEASSSTTTSAVHERPSPGTIDGLNPQQLQKLYVLYRDLATDLKRQGDRRLRPTPNTSSPSLEDQERSTVEQTDALLLYAFSFTCQDRASAVAHQEDKGKERVHVESWKSMAPLVEYVKDRAHRKGFNVPWALCCFVEAVMSQRLAAAERSRLLKAVPAVKSSPGATTKTTANGASTTTKDSPESASTSTSSSDHNVMGGSTSPGDLQAFLDLARWESRSQRAFSEASRHLSTYFLRSSLPDTARLCADLESRTPEAPTWLPHRPWWFCWPLNPYDCAADLAGFGRSVLEEYAGERLGLDFPAIELFIE